MDIRAIETWLNGRYYRSRTEARWALFLETLGEPFQYELEGFVLPAIPMNDLLWNPSADPQEVFYVPDFWLPRSQQWVEIKPPVPLRGWPDDLTREKAHRLAYHHHAAVVIVCGTPGLFDGDESNYPYCGFVPGDTGYLWCECPDCGAVGLQFSGRTDRMACKESKEKSGCPRHGNNQDKGYNWDTPRLRDAFALASKHRFDWRNKNSKGW